MQKVSVITMTYNDGTHLKKCAQQVLKQDYDNLEYIIVDGGSTDGTFEYLEKLKEAHGEKVIFVSEPDDGLYDALNKGIRMATGDIVGLMCDEFANEHIVTDMVAAMQKAGADGVHGDLDYVQDGKTVRRWRMGDGTINGGWMPAHPTLYLKKEIYQNYGLYKTNYKIAADYEFIIRILKDGRTKLAYLPDVLVHMYHGEASASTGGLKNYIDSFFEARRALVENQMPHPTWTCILRTFRVLAQFIRR
ncbi:MAG: glycosyltransferase [Lachnospiraceae bacterium]|nr:glycosyltransferase [Lachnospiraceae bacterium]